MHKCNYVAYVACVTECHNIAKGKATLLRIGERFSIDVVWRLAWNTDTLMSGSALRSQHVCHFPSPQLQSWNLQCAVVWINDIVFKTYKNCLNMYVIWHSRLSKWQFVMVRVGPHYFTARRHVTRCASMAFEALGLFACQRRESRAGCQLPCPLCVVCLVLSPQ